MQSSHTPDINDIKTRDISINIQRAKPFKTKS